MVEFALAAPVFLLFLFGVFGAGLNAFYQQVLDDSVRNAARQIQIAGPAANSSSGFVSAVCAQFGVLASDCSKSLSYSVQSSATSFSSLTPEPLNGSGRYSNAFLGSAAPGLNVLVQVAYPLPFTFPLLNNVLTGTGTSTIVTAAALQIEPYR